MLAISDCFGSLHIIAPGTTFEVVGDTDHAAVIMLLPVIYPDAGQRVRVDLTGRLDAEIAKGVLVGIWNMLAESTAEGGHGFGYIRSMIAVAEREGAENGS